MHRTDSPRSKQASLPGLEPIPDVDAADRPCIVCGGPIEIRPGSRTNYVEAWCGACRFFRWVPRPKGGRHHA
jgi:hypothetical protein